MSVDLTSGIIVVNGKKAVELNIPIVTIDYVHHSLEKNNKLNEDEKKRYYIFNPKGEYLSDYDDWEGKGQKLDKEDEEIETN